MQGHATRDTESASTLQDVTAQRRPVMYVQEVRPLIDQEIGDALGLTESNVSARISRARARLKRSLAAD